MVWRATECHVSSAGRSPPLILFLSYVILQAFDPLLLQRLRAVESAFRTGAIVFSGVELA